MPFFINMCMLECTPIAYKQTTTSTCIYRHISTVLPISSGAQKWATKALSTWVSF